MTAKELQQLPVPVAKLIQIGLKQRGFYNGTTKGRPGPRTIAAFQAFIDKETGRKASASTLAGKLVALAEKEVGVKESPRNSNRGKRVQEYQAASWLDGTGWAWCAAFICWLAREAGVSDSWRPKTAVAWDFERWARKHPDKVELIKPASKTEAKPGDILVFTFSHIGLAVAHESGDLVRTIEGNTDAGGSREGGGVWRKTRRKSQIRSIIRFK